MLERASFFICGVMSVLIGRVYGSLQRFAPTNQISLVTVHFVLLIIGAAAICISLLPSTWIRHFPSGPRNRRRRSIQFRFLLAFAAAALMLVILFNFIPPQSYEAPVGLVYSICPVCVLTVTVDPSLTLVIFALAPLNALVFGAIGGVIGTAVSCFSNKWRNIASSLTDAL